MVPYMRFDLDEGLFPPLLLSLSKGFGVCFLILRMDNMRPFLRTVTVQEVALQCRQCACTAPLFEERRFRRIGVLAVYHRQVGRGAEFFTHTPFEQCFIQQ